MSLHYQRAEILITKRIEFMLNWDIENRYDVTRGKQIGQSQKRALWGSGIPSLM